MDKHSKRALAGESRVDGRPSLILTATYLKWLLTGLLAGAPVWVLTPVSAQINSIVAANELQVAALIAVSCCGLLLAWYLRSRNPLQDWQLFFASGRVDVLMMVASGAGCALLGRELLEPHVMKAVAIVPDNIFIATCFLPFVVIFAFFVNALVWARRAQSETPYFITDTPIDSPEEDALDIVDEANRFSRLVLNNGSKASMVFGLDAPWGIGKTSFINLCEASWKTADDVRVVVHRFEPLRYDSKADLLAKFVEDFVGTIQKSVFAPEIGALVSRYARITAGKTRLSILGLSFEVEPRDITAEDALEELASALEKLRFRLIVVIDDLDRLDFSVVKNVLFALQKSFRLPNVSFVLCYDTENLVTHAAKIADADRVREFLEKFVTVKFGLFLDPSVIAKFVQQSFDEASKSYLARDPKMWAKSNKVISSLIVKYSAAGFENYRQAIGDIRKLKRLINTLLLLEIEKTDFEHSDFDGDDLLHLLLIYVNFPGTFRKIYDSETTGGSGFFSVIRDGRDAGRTAYANSASFVDFCKSIEPSPVQLFLLKAIFDPKVRLGDSGFGEFSELQLRTLACINGAFYGANRNLERYLKLIVKLAKPTKATSYRFYLKQLDRLKNGEQIGLIMSGSEFSEDDGASQTELLRIIVNSHEAGPRVGAMLIQYIVTHISKQSALEQLSVQINHRDDFTYFLIRILNDFGWSDSAGRSQENSDENLLQISKRIFGNSETSEMGIIATLASPDRGVLGWYDLMLFRLYCCASRGSDFFNLQKALVNRADPSAKAEGLVSIYEVLQMREISQTIFRKFKETYIETRRNWFDEVEVLTFAELVGDYSARYRDAVANGSMDEKTLEGATRNTKSGVKSFVIYQLANKLQGSGIGCGFYDPSGNDDKRGIATELNQYLFDVCFNPTGSPANSQHFVDFLLINFSRNLFTIDFSRAEFSPVLSEFTKILDPNKLKDFWQTHGSAIKSLQLEGLEKIVSVSGFSAKYVEQVPVLYKALDKMLVEDRDPVAAKQ